MRHSCWTAVHGSWIMREETSKIFQQKNASSAAAAVLLHGWDDTLTGDQGLCDDLADLGYHPKGIPSRTEEETTEEKKTAEEVPD